MNLKVAKILLSLLATAILAPGFASADTFTWTFAGLNISGSGILSADPAGLNTFLITGGTGSVTVNSDTFAVSFATCGSYPCTFTNTDGAGANLEIDNLLYPLNAPGAQLTYNGIALMPGPPASGASYIGIWDTPSQEFFNYTSVGYQGLSTPFTVTAVTAVPEPSILTLLGFGIGVVSLVSWRFKA